MLCTDFNEISMNGRMAYLIECIEKYLISRYPEKDWTELSKLLWLVTSNYWDEWDFKYVEVIPEYLFENSTYETSDFEYISKQEYQVFTSLLKDTDEETNKVLTAPHELQEIYCYSSIPEKGKEASEILIGVCDILEKNNINLPDISTVRFSKFDEKNGWGNQFDGRYLSIILH